MPMPEMSPGPVMGDPSPDRQPAQLHDLLSQAYSVIINEGISPEEKAEVSMFFRAISLAAQAQQQGQPIPPNYATPMSGPPQQGQMEPLGNGERQVDDYMGSEGEPLPEA